MSFQFFLAITLLLCTRISVNCDDPFNEFKEALGEECLQKHSIDLNALFMNVVMCIQQEITFPIMISGGDKASIVDLIVDFVCKADGLKKCVKIVPTKIAPCLSAEQNETLKHISNSLAAGQDYSCQQDGTTLKELVRDNDCLKCAGEEFKSCLYNNKSEASFLSLAQYSEEVCEKHVEKRRCINQVLDDEQVYKKFFDGLFDALLEATPCKQYL